jgi:predicted Na+-dependent transporter
LLQISFGLGKLLFYDSVAMQLGMFFTGVSPAGGASNIWTYVLGGNLSLSITMTTISTFAAFGKRESARARARVCVCVRVRIRACVSE